MNPSIRKLPKSVQYLLCASNQINGYLKVVQELVFNSLDADATSIAIRIHIAKGSLQVIDNGTGILQTDLKFVGQNYMTSKVVDMSTLKSAPNKYGFQGQSLATLVQISETLIVASRFHKSETTWVKVFENGKAKCTNKCNLRPSKGTTVEIKGFLYNLNIQKKSVNVLNELQSIKTFLEHMSLVYSSISISLRDDSKNEIVYQIHKNRDIFQTISTLYEIDKSNIQELQVEKNQYKVKAYIGKKEEENVKKIIFVNGRAIPNSSILHNKVNGAFKKYFGFREENKNIKKNVTNDKETQLFMSCFPFYLIFITCPYIDYEYSSTMLEFKDYGPISTLLEKLIQFYIGDIYVKEPKKKNTTETSGKQSTESTRNEVKIIMHKILGSHCRKPEISNMQNGKMIKRKGNPKKSTLKLSKYPINIKKKLDQKTNTEPDFINMDIMNQNQNTKKFNFITTISPKLKNNDNEKTQSSKTLKKIKMSIRPETDKKLNQKRKASCKFATKRKSGTKNKINQNNKSCSKKLCLHSIFAMETESIKRRCESLAEKTKDFINYHKRKSESYVDENVLYTQCNFTKDNKNITIHKKVQELLIHQYIPKSNINIQVNDNLNNKTFKSTYDLLHTIIKSQTHLDIQKEPMNNPNNYFPVMSESKCNGMPLIRERFLACPSEKKSRSYDFIQSAYESEHISPYSHVGTLDRNEPLVKKVDYTSMFTTDHKFIAPLTRTILQGSENTKSSLQGTTNNRYNITLFEESDDMNPSEAVTFQSHHYNERNMDDSIKKYHSCYKSPRKFITTNSRNNFLIQNEIFETNVRKNRHSYSKPIRAKKYDSSLNKVAKSHFQNDNIQDSFIIEFSESIRNEYTSLKNNFSRNNTIDFSKNIESLTPSMSNIFNDPNYILTKDTWSIIKNNDCHPIRNKKTSSLTSPKIICYDRNSIVNNNETLNYGETNTVENLNESSRQIRHNSICHSNVNAEINCNFVFVSKSQENNDKQQIINPIDVCETILRDVELTENKSKEFDNSFSNIQDCLNNLKNKVIISPEMQNEFTNSMNNIDACRFNDKHLHNNSATFQTTLNKNDLEEISHHFTIFNSNISEIRSNQIRISEVNNEKATDANGKSEDAITFRDNTNINEDDNIGAFYMENRLCFVPKGMSPIFKECQTKSNCHYDLNADYYEDKIYTDFVCKLQSDVEIFKPRIDEANDTTNNNITKVNSKLNKTKASLKFDGQCIKTIKVLGQVDKKFIAAIIKGKTDIEEYLVLFDQHAVHERIRLEKNLADYVSGSQWKSVTIDEFALKMSRDEILYIHNYREKFTKFGLQWTIPNYNEISVNAIPEGILGKNTRQVDKIIKAVKNLIKEEIYNLQMQRGCVSLYPKSIMDLVFSEACRYAIKFGEHLSKSRCVELLNELSHCKTPFQCAHGRPAMAVIMNIESNETKYEVNINKIKHFIGKM